MSLIWFKSSVVLAIAATLLGGCAAGPHPPVALALAPGDPAADATFGGGPAPERAERMPSPAEIFDFHPRGASPGMWREPFVVSYTEGPLNAYRLKTLAELRQLADHRYDLAAAPR